MVETVKNIIYPSTSGQWYEFVNRKIIGTRLKDVNVSYFVKKEFRNYILTFAGVVPKDEILILIKSCELIETEVEDLISKRVKPYLDRELVIGCKIKKVLQRGSYNDTTVIAEFDYSEQHRDTPNNSLISKLCFHNPEEVEVIANES